MVVSPHVAVGVAIGALVSNPVIIVPAALASHYLLDAVPHWQETLAPYIPTKKTYIRTAVDLLLSIGLVLLAIHWLPSHTFAIWAGAIAANIPDLDAFIAVFPGFKKGFLKKYWDWHCKIQRETSSVWGVLTQIVVIIAGMLIVYGKA